MIEGTGFEGVNPRSAKLATPNSYVADTPFPTPGRTPSIAMGSKQGSAGGGSNMTPSLNRDQFGLNSGLISGNSDAFSVSDVSSVGSVAGSRLERIRDKEMKLALLNQLKQIPEPEYSYEISLPAAPSGGEGEDAMDIGAGTGNFIVYYLLIFFIYYTFIIIVLTLLYTIILYTGTLHTITDATDLEEQRQHRILQHQQAIEASKSTVLKRHLPRPTLNEGQNYDHLLIVSNIDIDDTAATSEKEEIYITKLILQEMYALIQYDNYMYPLANGSSTDSGSGTVQGQQYITDRDEISGADLNAAKAEVQLELERSNGSGSDGTCLLINKSLS